MVTKMSYDELLDKLYDAYYDCRKKKGNSESALLFELDYESRLKNLADRLWNGTYEIGKSIAFAVTRPKLREVFAAGFEDRIVHHLVINEIGGILDNEMIADSFSCRVGKGVLYGVDRLREQIVKISNNYKNTAYTLSMDLSGFFMSIDKELCYRLIETTLIQTYHGPDLGWWLNLTKKIVMHRPELNCEIHGDKTLLESLPDHKTLFRSNGKGFPIGNLTSQIFGIFYLTGFDKWSIAYLGDKGCYCRYVDDIRATSQDRKLLMHYMHDAREWLQKNLYLNLHPRKWSLQEVHHGIPFIGSVVMPWGTYAGKRLVGNAFEVAKHPGDNLEHFVMQMNSYFGFLCHHKTYAIRWKLWKAIPDSTRVQVVCHRMEKLTIKKSVKARLKNSPGQQAGYQLPG